MKYLRPYKIFEDIDENDIIPDGFKYSWNNIYEGIKLILPTQNIHCVFKIIYFLSWEIFFN